MAGWHDQMEGWISTWMRTSHRVNKMANDIENECKQVSHRSSCVTVAHAQCEEDEFWGGAAIT